MASYLAKRLGQSLVIVAVVASLVFLSLRLFGGNPAAIAALPGSSAAVIRQYQISFGLNHSIGYQYWTFVTHIVRGDFGVSFRIGHPAMALVGAALARTGLLVGLALVLSLLLSIVLGILAARHPGSLTDRAGGLAASVLQSIPAFWLSIVLVVLLSVRAQLLPALGNPTPSGLVLPVVAVTAAVLPEQFRLVRASASEAIAQDYVRSARGLGVPERVILFRYVLKNSVLPLLTVLGLQIGYLLGGAAAVEVVFDYPGIGTLAQQALLARDFPIIQALTIVSSAVFLLLNLLVDVLYQLLNRRVVI